MGFTFGVSNLRGRARGYEVDDSLKKRVYAHEKWVKRQSQKPVSGKTQVANANRQWGQQVTALVHEAGLAGMSCEQIVQALCMSDRVNIEMRIERHCLKLYFDSGRWYHMDFDITKAQEEK